MRFMGSGQSAQGIFGRMVQDKHAQARALAEIRDVNARASSLVPAVLAQPRGLGSTTFDA